MDHFVYIAASGARETMLAQAANSHNLSNASTTGFRADLVAARSAYLSGAGQRVALMQESGARESIFVKA